jgi:uncharacterized protein (DUF1499 family)
MALSVVAVLLALAVVGVIYIRTVGHDPALWHVDPVVAERSGRPNDAVAAPPGLRADAEIEAPVLPVSPEAAAERLDAIIRAAPRVSVVAGDPADGFVTYVQRSAWVGWPDYISVKAVEAGEGASVVVWSRSRFGYSDMGVNRERLERWMEALD